MKVLITLLLSYCLLPGFGQSMEYEPDTAYPYGRLNPSAPKAVSDYSEMIGSSNCISVQRSQDGTWLDSLDMIWKFSYIMNGTAVQDEVFREGGLYAGSLRQYQSDSAKWYVSYYSSLGLPPYSVWTGNREGNRIVLYKPNSVIQNRSGTSRLTFYDISASRFKWEGEWLSDDGTIEFVFWRISCEKRREDK